MKEARGREATAAAAIPAVQEHPPVLRGARLVASDPVFKFLHRKLGEVQTIALNLLLASIVFFGGAAVSGGLFNRNYGKAGSGLDFSTARLLDMTTSLRKLLLILLALLVYFLLPCWVARLFNNLEKNMVIANPCTRYNSYEHFLRDMVRKMDSRLWSLCGVFTVVLFWIHRLTDYDGSSRPIWLEIAALLIYALAYYTFFPTLIKLWIALFYTNRLFKSFRVRVTPLHPDNAGGLGPVRQMLTNYVMVFAAFGILVAAGMISSYYRAVYGGNADANILSRTETQLMLIGYTSFPLLLWGWLWVPHQVMKDARDQNLLVLAEEFMRATPCKDRPPAPAAPILKENTERLSELKKQYELLRETYPTWPIRFRQFNRLVALASTPLLTSALPAIVESLTVFVSTKLRS